MSTAVRSNDIGEKIIEEYLELFNLHSFKNQLYGKISLHVILGQLLSKSNDGIGGIYYKQGAREIDPRVHLLLIKPQGTGKGAGYGFVERTSRALGLDFQSLTESTDAGLVGTLQDNEIVPGLLQSADVVGMEEASVLFDYASDFSRKNMTYMQITMNALEDSSCNITKKLGTETIEFKPHASFVLMTYPPDKLVDKLLKTGFIDRVIPIFEDVTLIDRLEIIEIMLKNINVTDKESFKKKFDELIKKIKNIEDKYRTVRKKIDIPEEMHKVIFRIISEFANKVQAASPKAREKLEHFVTRLHETLLKLAIHHAVLCRRETVEMSDVLYARLLYIPIWRNLIISIESLLIISPQERARKHRIIKTALDEYDKQMKKREFVKNKVWVRRTTMLENLQPLWDNCSLETADNNLMKLEKSPELEYSKISKYERDKFFERKMIGHSAYLKKIKDIK